MPVIAEAHVIRANPTAGYLAVKVEMLRRLPSATVDLFIQYEPKAPPVLYTRAHRRIDVEHLSTLANSGVTNMFVRCDDFHAFGTHLLATVESLMEVDTVPQAECFAALQLAMAVEIERAVHVVDCGPYVELAGKVARDLTTLFSGSDVLPRDLFRLARHDFNTFTHVTNVAGYAVVLARRLGVSDTEQLEQIARGAMLHDVGKRFISTQILTKPASLTSEERTLIETHPQRGYEELCRRSDVTFEQLMMVYQHHERIDGRGYPVGVVGEEIHDWAKILAVVDVFDAMTGMRPYRRRATVDDALTYLRRNAGTQFDLEAVECWQAAYRNVIADDWEAADNVVLLPEMLREGFLEKRGPMPLHFENKRCFHRHYMRGKAILYRGDAKFGVYTKDVSRQGIGLLSPVQLLPLENIRLALPDGSRLQLEVSRCRRLEKDCFDCGTRFLL